MLLSSPCLLLASSFLLGFPPTGVVWEYRNGNEGYAKEVLYICTCTVYIKHFHHTLVKKSQKYKRVTTGENHKSSL